VHILKFNPMHSKKSGWPIYGAPAFGILLPTQYTNPARINCYSERWTSVKDDYGRISECNPEELEEALARRDQDATKRRLERQVRQAMPCAPGAQGSWDQQDTLACAGAMVRALKPTDAAEWMIAAKLVIAHNVGVDLAQRAMKTDNLEHREQMLKFALKFMDSSTRYSEALDKHRGKGEQNVTVKYVNVASGGQAIVGNVETVAKTRQGRRKSKQKPLAIADAPAVAFELPERAAERVVSNHISDDENNA
jgi:hypothetical protein